MRNVFVGRRWRKVTGTHVRIFLLLITMFFHWVQSEVIGKSGPLMDSKQVTWLLSRWASGASHLIQNQIAIYRVYCMYRSRTFDWIDKHRCVWCVLYSTLKQPEYYDSSHPVIDRIRKSVDSVLVIGARSSFSSPETRECRTKSHDSDNLRMHFCSYVDRQ